MTIVTPAPLRSKSWIDARVAQNSGPDPGGVYPTDARNAEKAHRHVVVKRMNCAESRISWLEYSDRRSSSAGRSGCGAIHEHAGP